MSHAFPNLNTKVRPSDRRVFRRQSVRSLAYVELGEGNGGIVLNVSEGGIAVQAVMSLMNEEVPCMRLQLAHSNKQIETKGRVTWTSDFRKLAGVQFVDLSPQALTQIREWIALENPERQKAEPAAVPRTELAASLATQPSAASSGSEQEILIEHLLSFTGKTPESSVPPAASAAKATTEASITAEGLAAPVVKPIPEITAPQEPILKPPVSTVPVTPVAPKVPEPLPRIASDFPEPRKNFLASSSPPPDRYGFKHGPLEEFETPAVGTAPKDSKTVLVVGVFAIASLVIGWVAGRSGLRRVVVNDASGENLPEESQPVIAPPKVSEIEVIDAKNQRWMIPFNGPSTRAEKKTADQSAANNSGISGNNNAVYQNPSLVTPIPVKNRSGIAGENFKAPLVPYSAQEKPPSTPATSDSRGSIPIPLPAAQTAPDKSGDLQPGELTQRVEPVYPPEALAERIEGTVRLDAVIDAEGNVKSVQVLSGPKQLLDAASEAVRKWHYSPTLLNGMPIQTERQVTIRFQLAPNQPN